MFFSPLQKLLIAMCLLLSSGILIRYWYLEAEREEGKRVASQRMEIQKKAAAEYKAKEAQRSVKEATQREEAERRLIDEKTDELRAVLDRSVFDPYSMRLRNVRLVQGSGGYALCGDISAKLASGKFFAERPFAVTETPLERAGGQVVGILRSRDAPDPKTTKALLDAAGC